VMPIGNTTPVRDYLHVADVVRAYVLLAEHGAPGEAYNIASGTGTGVADLARMVLERARVRAELHPDPALQRPVDVPALVGDPRKLAAATGWKPERTLDTLIDDLLHATPR
jgi:GDP-4-dehydro-6-deoxy-D-mannose reductase